MYERMLHQYAELLGRADRVPQLERNAAPRTAAKHAAIVLPEGTAGWSA